MDVRRISEISFRVLEKKDNAKIIDIISRVNNFNSEDKRIAIELINHYLEYDDGEYLIDVILSDGNVLGYVCYGQASLTKGVYEIYYIAIDPNNQGRGLGKMLMQNVEKKLVGKARMILLETSSDESYLATQRFYLKIGYAEIFRIKDYYDIGEDKILYQKIIK